MTLYSDEIKSKFFKPFLAIRDFFMELDYSFIFGLSSLIIAYATLYYFYESFWIFTIGIVLSFFVMLSSEGTAGAFVYYVMQLISIAITTAICFFGTPTKTVSDTMDMKPFIKTIKDAGTSGDFTLGLKQPFEKEVSFTFNSHSTTAKFGSLFNTREFYKDFNISVKKECKTYRLGNVDCDITMYIDNKFHEEGHLIEQTLTDSVYPKTLKI